SSDVCSSDLFEMAALAVYHSAVGIGEFHRVVIIDFPIIFAGAPRAASGTLYRYRITSFHPVGHVDIVYVLLYDMVATQPIEVIPITHLVFHFGLFRFTRAYPYAPAIPIHLARYDVAQRAILYALDGLAVIGLVTALEAHNHIQLLPLGFLRCCQHPAYPWNIG